MGSWLIQLAPWERLGLVACLLILAIGGAVLLEKIKEWLWPNR